MHYKIKPLRDTSIKIIFVRPPINHRHELCALCAPEKGFNLLILIKKIYMLFAGWEVRIVKNFDRDLENAARGRRPRAAFSMPR